MNLQQLIKFGLENSQEPVIKNPVLREALVGTPTKEVTQFDKRIYETPEGERVSEKSTTFFLNGKWLNVPTIHNGRSFTDDQLRLMIKQGQIQPTSVHGSRNEAEEAAASRSNMMKSHVKGFADGQLVTPSVDGSRPGYQGPPAGVNIEKQKILRKKAERSKTKINQILKENSKTKNGFAVLNKDLGGVGPKKAHPEDTMFKLIRNAFSKDDVEYKTLYKTFKEAVKEGNYILPKDYKREMIVKVFMDDYAKNGFFTGNAKFDPRLEEFKIKPVGPHTSAKQYPTFQEINRVFKEWAQGDWEVSGIDRSNKNVFDKTLNKTLKNWKSTRIRDQMVQLRDQLKFLNNLNDNHPKMELEKVKNLFNKEFKNSPYWSDTTFANRTNQLYPFKVYGSGRNDLRVDGVGKGERSSWLKEEYRKRRGGNLNRVLIAADKAEANGDIQLAKKLRQAGDEIFMAKGVLGKVVGQAEHPWFYNYGKGLFQIDSLVKGDLNNFKANNFEIPIRKLITEYEKKKNPPTSARKKAIEAEIKLRRKFLNTMTDIGDGGMARNVTFDFTAEPGKIKVINKTPDIYQLHKTGKLDPLELQTRGTAYRNAVIKNLKEADYNIMKKGTEVMKTQKIGLNKMNKFLDLTSKSMQTDLGPRSIAELSKIHGCGKKSEGGSIMSCLQGKFKADPEKFLQKSAPLAKDNANLFKWFKNGRKIARGTGIALAWEAAFAPIIGGWAALEGESMPRIINEIAYGIPFIGETTKEEWMREAGGDELAYKMKRMGELENEEIPYLQQQLNDVINKMSHVPGKGSPSQYWIQKDIEEKKLELQGLLNTPEFYEGPAGGQSPQGDYGYNEPVIQGAFDLEQQTTAKIAADKAERKKQRLDALRNAGIIANQNWQSQIAPRYAQGGIASLNVKK